MSNLELLSDNNVKRDNKFTLKVIRFLSIILCLGGTIIIICYFDIYQASQIKQYVYDNASYINITCDGEGIDINDYKSIVNLFVVKSIFDLLFFLFAIVNIVTAFVIFSECHEIDFPLTCWFFSSIVYVLYNILTYPMIKSIKDCDYINAYQKYNSYNNWYYVSFILCCIYGALLGVIIAVSVRKSKSLPYVSIEKKSDI